MTTSVTICPEASALKSWPLRHAINHTRTTVPAQSEVYDEADELRFRQFICLPGRRLLLKNGIPVELGSRAFDLLSLLVQSRGTILSKDEIFRRVWPTTTVEESNLRLQITSLRRALGNDRDLIKTVPGRGYLFAAEPAQLFVERAAPEHGGPDAPTTEASLCELLFALTGRSRGEPQEAQMMSSVESCELLRALLHSALDQLWDKMLLKEQALRQIDSA